MSTHQVAVIRFVLENAPNAPIRDRISIYTGLADFCGQADEAKQLQMLAAELTAVEDHARQFTFEFNRKSK